MSTRKDACGAGKEEGGVMGGMITAKLIKCQRCDGHGQVAGGPNYPDECPDCGGSGVVVRYPSGAIAKYVGGPFLSGRPARQKGGA